MITLGIESTAHTFGVGIVKDKKILANVKDTFTTEQGGMIPDLVKDHHIKVKDKVLQEALDKANLKLEDIDVISFSQGPGLAPALGVGRDFAVKLSKNKPLVGVNHICAHLEIGRLITDVKDPIFVFVSGANTQIIAHEGDRYRVFGECLSIALGNALDKFAREAGVGFPGGPKIEQLAKKGKYIELPYSVKGMDVDFSGILTKAKQLLAKGEKVENLCYSLQETMFAMLVEVTERALAHCEKNEVLLIGGVAANKRFHEMMTKMCEDRGAKFYTVPLEYAGDNAAMIAWLGSQMYEKGLTVDKDVDFNPNWRIDDIETKWF